MKLVWPITFALLFIACEEAKIELVQTQISERTAKFRAERTAENQQKLLDEASKMVDSFLLDEARRRLQDSLGHIRPFKPARPNDVPPLDSLKVVEPLFHKN